MFLARPCLPMLLLLLMPSVAQAQSSFRPTVTLDPASGQVVGVGRLSTTPGCASASGTGRVVKRHVERGALRGITFKDDKYGEGFVNVEDTRQIRDPALRRQVEDGLARLLAVGSEVAVHTLGCGAAGRVEELVSVKLKGGAAPAAGVTPSSGSLTLTAVGQSPAAGPTKWRLTNPSKVQIMLAVTSTDRKFVFSLSCMNTGPAGLHFSSYFMGPRNWSAQMEGAAISIDGARFSWEIGGADDGYSISDSMMNNMMVLSPSARTALAKGQRLIIDGKMDRGGAARGATFDISGGEAIFARFEEKCRALPAA